MRKIGILTFQNTTNYGAVLQAFALQKKIELLGADCEIINYHCNSIECREFVRRPKLTFDFYLFACNWKDYISNRKKRKIINEFVKKYIRLSDKEYINKNIAMIDKIYDAFIVGSDMVWEVGITGEDYNYYLQFASPYKRNSYAASIGLDNIEERYTEKCTKELNQFRRISVRETRAKEILNQLVEKDVNINIDPTLLHDCNFWRKYEEKPEQCPEKYILLYFLDESGVMLNTALNIAKEKNVSILILDNKDINVENCRVIKNASVPNFLYYIRKAFLMITGSYHGMVFSMNFKTDFMYYNRANSSRMESIAELTGSQSRRLTSSNIPEINCDFESIDLKIHALRKESTEYLKEICEKGK